MGSTAALSLDLATRAEQPIVADLLQLYIGELSVVFPGVERGPDGRYRYDRLPLYWSEPDRRFPFLIRRGGIVAGFVLATRGSPVTSDASAFDVAEFFVSQPHRRSGIGTGAASLLWSTLPGTWTVRVAESNHGALEFWRRAAAAYSDGTAKELELSGRPHAWRVFILEGIAGREPAR